MNIVPAVSPMATVEWNLPARGKVAMTALIIGESAIFTIFVVAYLFYFGKSQSGPTPKQVLEIPIFGTICLLSSSLSIWRAERALAKGRVRSFAAWLALTIALGATFLIGTSMEWKKLIYQDGLTISTNLFGTTFYSLVGLHAIHVVVGLTMLTSVLLFALAGQVSQEHSERLAVISLYWHFVDVVWVVVSSVVYVVGR